MTLLIFIDQYSKILAVNYLKNSQAKTIIDNVLLLRYLENPGAAWGIMSGKTMLFTMFTVIILVLMIVLMIRIEIVKNKLSSKKQIFIFQFLLVILASGAVGNLIDRIRLGYVIDFIYFKIIDFPTFNVADCYVTISTILIIILLVCISENDWNTILTRKEK